MRWSDQGEAHPAGAAEGTVWRGSGHGDPSTHISTADRCLPRPQATLEDRRRTVTPFPQAGLSCPIAHCQASSREAAGTLARTNLSPNSCQNLTKPWSQLRCMHHVGTTTFVSVTVRSLSWTPTQTGQPHQRHTLPAGNPLHPRTLVQGAHSKHSALLAKQQNPPMPPCCTHPGITFSWKALKCLPLSAAPSSPP